MIVVVDYGVNNLASVVRALAAGGHAATLAADPAVVRRAERVVMPGVGHFARAAENLARAGLDEAVRDEAAAGRPVLGICLGAQLIADGLGAGVRRNREPEIGWYPLRLTAEEVELETQ